MPQKRNPNAPFWIAMSQEESRIIDKALSATGGNVTRAANALGIDRSYLSKLIKSLGIDRSGYRSKGKML